MLCVDVDVVCCCELLAFKKICLMSLFDVVAGCCWCHFGLLVVGADCRCLSLCVGV